jgi:hypothetical protein
VKFFVSLVENSLVENDVINQSIFTSTLLRHIHTLPHYNNRSSSFLVDKIQNIFVKTYNFVFCFCVALITTVYFLIPRTMCVPLVLRVFQVC